MVLYSLAADVVLVVHAAFITFVVVGLLLVLIGVAAHWQWVRDIWFRAAHLLAIALVVVQSWAGAVCPLTTVEAYLRRRADQPFYAGSFVAHWLRRIIFYEAEQWVFVLCYSAFGALTLFACLICPPRWPRRGDGTAAAAATPEPVRSDRAS